MSKHRTIDLTGFYAALESKRRAYHKSARQVCREAGVSQNTYSRLAKGHSIDLFGFAALCNWMGVSADKFLSLSHDEPLDTRASIAAILASDPTMSDASSAIMAVLDLAARPSNVPGIRLQQHGRP